VSRRLLYPLYRRVFPHWVRNALERSIVELERFHPPRSVELPPGERVLLLAPHPDDETIGCGGTLRKYVEAGARVRVVVLTDGRQGDSELRRLAADDPARSRLESELASRRKGEALAALAVLGVQEHEFLEVRDGELREAAGAVASTLARMLSEWRPDLVLLPFVTDRHADHFAANRCFLEAVGRLKHGWTAALQCLAYEIWSPIYANLYVDITATMDWKRRALGCYRSQLDHMDFAAGVEGLNRFRAVSGLVRGRYAEAFFLAPLPTYRRLYRSLLL
jgi:LmbE family N-acetylglucosaminyl deacetylase